MSIADNIKSVSLRIQNATKSTGRAESEVLLLAVSKTKPVADIREAYAAGLRNFGENYLQEALEKISEFSEPDVVWHFIGPLQSNKTRPVAEHFQWVHTVDRLKIARRLSDQRPESLPPLNVCIQVNVDHQATKSGIQLDEVDELAAQIADLPNLRLRGLMCIPDPGQDESGLRQSFGLLREKQQTLSRTYPSMDTLSMGMSHDLELAIAEGATIVRIGTALFGAREYQNH